MFSILPLHTGLPGSGDSTVWGQPYPAIPQALQCPCYASLPTELCSVAIPSLLPLVGGWYLHDWLVEKCHQPPVWQHKVTKLQLLLVLQAKPGSGELCINMLAICPTRMQLHVTGQRNQISSNAHLKYRCTYGQMCTLPKEHKWRVFYGSCSSRKDFLAVCFPHCYCH